MTRKLTAIVCGLIVCACVAFATGQTDTESQTLVFWHSFSEGVRLEQMKKNVAAFQKENPNITFNVEVYPWADFTTKWKLGVSTGELPDVSSVQHTQLPLMNRAGILYGVDTVIDSIGRDKFYENTLRYITVDGKALAIPFYNIARVLWYRKDILAKNGITPPKTWDEYKSLAVKLNSPPDYFGQVVPLSKNAGEPGAWLYSYVISRGKSFISDDGKIKLTIPEVYDGVRFWIDMYHAASPEGSLNYGTTETSNLWYQGKTAFDINTGFHIDGILRNSPQLDGKIGAVLLPKPTADSKYPSGFADYMCMTMYKKTKVPQIAGKLLAFLFEDARYIEFMHQIAGGMMPARKDIAQSAAYKANDVIKRYQNEVDVVLQAIATCPPTYCDKGISLAASVLGTNFFLGQMYQRIIVENVPIEVAVRDAEEQFNKVLADYK